jgi:hypothetical protein
LIAGFVRHAQALDGDRRPDGTGGHAWKTVLSDSARYNGKKECGGQREPRLLS